MPFTIRNPNAPNIRCMVDSIGDPGTAVPLVTDGDGVARLKDFATAKRLVEACDYQWVKSGLPDGFIWHRGEVVVDVPPNE